MWAEYLQNATGQARRLNVDETDDDVQLNGDRKKPCVWPRHLKQKTNTAQTRPTNKTKWPIRRRHTAAQPQTQHNTNH